MTDPLGPIGPLHLAIYVLLGIAIGWAAGRRAPDGIEYRAWLRLVRRFGRRRAA
jgi:hypothetical protein